MFTLLTILGSFLASLDTKILQSDITVTMAQKVSQPLSYNGSFTMQGDKFLLNMFDLQAAYDGKTMYLYSSETDELTLSYPTQQELYETNPLLFAKALLSKCNLTERTLDDGTVVTTLTPQDTSLGIQSFVVRLKNNLPVSAEMREGKTTTTLSFRNPNYISRAPAFLISKPDAELIDLR